MAILTNNPLPAATSGRRIYNPDTGSRPQQAVAQAPSPFMATAAAVPQTAAATPNAVGPFRSLGSTPLAVAPLQSQGATPLTPPYAGPTMSQGSIPLAPPAVSPTQPPVPTTSPVGSAVEQLYPALLDEADIMGHYINQLTASNNPLMRNARIQGIEQAASRGLQNSSIAGGASQRAALDAVVPLATQAFGLFGDREQRGWQTGERLGQQEWQTSERTDQQAWQTQQDREQRDWTGDQNRLDREQQLTMSEVQNWLNNESFVRDFNAQLSLIPVSGTMQLLNTIMQQAVDAPDVYTPDVVSGFSEFFNTNMLDVLAGYFPTLFQARTGG